MKKVSIIVPIYGVEKYIRECIDSILKQTLKDIEIILIDDGGKDLCPQIIDEYAAKDDRIKVIHKENGGYGHSCNVGLNNASGEYVAIVEPDDFIDEKMYEELYSIAVKNDSDIVKTPFCYNIKFGNKFYILDYIWQDLPKESFCIKDNSKFLYYHPSVWSCIYKREFLEQNKIRFIEAPGSGWTDNPFQVQTMCLAKRINYIPKAYYYWRVLDNNASNELKDYKIPFIRSDEIHEWLQKNNITDKDILENLYRRELAYIGIVLGMKHIPDMKDCLNRIKHMLARMDEDVVLNGKYFNPQEKKIYKKCKTHPLFYRFILRLKIIRHALITIRWNSTEHSIFLFKKCICYNRKNNSYDSGTVN